MGIFASIQTDDGWVLQRVAGVAGNAILDLNETFIDLNQNGIFDAGAGEIDTGFVGFGVNSRVGVNYNLLKGRGLGTITYLATDQAGKEGLYTSTLSTTISGAQSFTMNPLRLVAKVGDSIEGMDGTIQDLEIFDPINQAGQIAFWASFTDGQKAIIRANPEEPKIINVATHGFGNYFAPFSNFLDGWFTLGNKLEGLSYGTSLEGDVKSYVANWDSSSGWVEGIFSFMTGVVFRATGNPRAARIAFDVAQAQMDRAARLAENAAQTIIDDVKRSGLLGEAAQSKNGEQIIRLIGHSRGGAVNARVAKLLTEQGYHIDQYIALDGYSTDWPHLSGILGDISIQDEVNASDIRRRVNYRVQDGLADLAVEFAQPYGAFSDSTKATIKNGLPDWKAPERGGSPTFGKPFENLNLVGQGSDRTNHVNVTVPYTFSDLRSNTKEQYILNDFNETLTANNLSTQSLRTQQAFPSFRSASQSLTVSPNSADGVATTNNFASFTDGSFEVLGESYQEILTTDFSTDDPAITQWVADIKDPSRFLSTLWDIQGNVKLVFEGNNTLVELTQTEQTSLGQLLSFTQNSETLDFDLSILAAGADDRLQVLFQNQVLKELPLVGTTSTRHSVSLAGFASRSGDLTFQIAGPTDTPAMIRLDNLSVQSGATLLPTLSLANLTTSEGNGQATFTVTLSAASSDTVTVNYTTSDGTAKRDLDYTASSGQLTFAPGELSKTFNVPLLEDSLDELDETFNVTLSSPTKAEITTATATATLMDNDDTPVPPSLSINNVTVLEGNSGTVNATFTVTLSAPSTQTITVRYGTRNGSAIVPEDYTATSGTLTFAPGQTSLNVTVPVLGDTTIESDETFLVDLSVPINATIATASGTGNITNDDAPAEGKTGTAPPPINFAGQPGLRLRGSNRSEILRGSRKNDRLTALNGNDRVLAGAGNDRVRGGQGNDVLRGGSGNDLLDGEAGNDTISGEAGNDVLAGGTGADQLTGGAGLDLFSFNRIAERGDTIMDFDSDLDLIDLRRIFANAAFAGTTPFARFEQFIDLVQVGANTEVRIDIDGNGSGTTFSKLVTLNKVAISVVDSENFVLA